MTALIVVYCLAVIAASLFGGLIPILVRMTHTRMQTALSFVSGVMFGVAMLHLLPHAIMQRQEAAATVEPIGHAALDPIMWTMLGGFVVMFLLQRFFDFHHHEQPVDGECAHAAHAQAPAPANASGARWVGALFGLTIHSLIGGVALAASIAADVEHLAHHGEPFNAWAALPGLSMWLVIVLHKPFDAMTISALMTAAGASRGMRHFVNALFGLVVPIGMGLFYLGLRSTSGDGGGDVQSTLLVGALAFSAGTFLCIALSDVLPELQFHKHDRVKLTVALVAGLVLAALIAKFEAAGHDHSHDHSTESLEALDHDHDHDDHSGHDHSGHDH